MSRCNTNEIYCAAFGLELFLAWHLVLWKNGMGYRFFCNQLANKVAACHFYQFHKSLLVHWGENLKNSSVPISCHCVVLLASEGDASNDHDLTVLKLYAHQKETMFYKSQSCTLVSTESLVTKNNFSFDMLHIFISNLLWLFDLKQSMFCLQASPVLYSNSKGLSTGLICETINVCLIYSPDLLQWSSCFF